MVVVSSRAARVDGAVDSVAVDAQRQAVAHCLQALFAMPHFAEMTLISVNGAGADLACNSGRGDG
jgi:hypothetical protein